MNMAEFIEKHPNPTDQEIRRALVGMVDDPNAAPIMARIRFKGFSPATDKDYDGVRRVYRLVGQ
jgi:phosphonate transport system substrate-binding protein